MCGICGVIGGDPRQVEPATRAMMRAMIHRGPDDDGYEELPLAGDESGRVAGFGFRRLSILDLSPAGHQPMFDEKTGNCLVFNGEIYNFKELRIRLQMKGHVFRSTGDTEVLLRALGEWGEYALADLDGMFGLAFYHAATRRVLLARDPMGIKPLYVAKVPGRFVFASEVRAVLASGLVPRELDPAGIATFLAYGAPQDPLTVHRFVRSLQAGGLEWIGIDQLQGAAANTRRYWRFPEIDRQASLPAAIVTTRGLLADSVRRQCIADVPIGVFLSAGIDSGTLAALARSDHDDVRTFSVAFDKPASVDESKLAAETAWALGTQHRQTVIDEERGVSEFDQWLKSADRPSIDGMNTFVISDAVKEQGVSVALSGLGADELFGGYANFRNATRLRKLLAPLAFTPHGLRRSLATAVFARFPAIKRAKAAEMFARGVSPAAMTLYSRRMFLDEHLGRLGLFSDRLGLTPDYLPAEGCEGLERVGDPFKEVSRAELSLYMRNTLLRDSDVYSMAHSLEIRVPFLGQRVVDHACSQPGAVLMPSRKAAKYVLREAIHDLLPDQVFTRPKTGFLLPIDDWTQGWKSDRCNAALDTLAASPLFSQSSVREIWRELQDPRIENFYWRRLSLVVLGNYLAAQA